ncbi:Arogenate dehydratase/prephenate dehydratase 1 isoform 1 [Hibiscus syriacus]|uniref:Arogenate dehydratase/prephenate dehydratase 1 isoform 1 n=1 Tax=Hibiscus syriacus TaxID=106335 RepID=A0A6A3DAZ4_HIBSY|nr:Arogenate dehydratase/prephenate dehydratase 1 isoform 1 [Hibiscus syriacus]
MIGITVDSLHSSGILAVSKIILKILVYHLTPSSPEDDENLLKNIPILDRVIVISAGVVANIIFAYAIIFTQVLSVRLPVQEPFSGISTKVGDDCDMFFIWAILSAFQSFGHNFGYRCRNCAQDPNSKTNRIITILSGVIIPDVRPFSAASRDGLLPDDVILSINGKIGVHLSPNIKITKLRPNNIFEAFNYTGKEFWGLTYNVLDSLKQTFMNFSQSASKVSGPVAIIAVGAEVARSTVDGLYEFAALLNLNLAVINLLPLPALDGGSLALVLLEAARGGRKLPLELEQRIMSSGIMFVLLLGLFLIVRDTLNLEFIKDLL